MCEVMERYKQEAVTKANVNSIKFMITTFDATEDQILGNENYTKTEYNTAIKELAEESDEL